MATCNAASVTRYRENNTQLGFKGEGIYKSTDVLHNNARAKILNGGGGGSNHNGGGGGGGNFTEGGLGGNGWNNCTTNPAGGFGGISLSSEISGDRIFMGGGGGGGQQNNTQGRNGGDGGGIILLKATEITTDACAGVSISANGLGPATSGTNDGGGGGGAAGSIVFWVDTWSVTPGCPLIISANGGDGSSSLSGGSHAGGGGGAQGVIVYNGAEPSPNVTTELENGAPGCGNTSNPCNSLAGSPSGTDGLGLFTGTFNPLPIELVNFEANLVDNRTARLSWITKSEINNDYFTLYWSADAENWVEIGKKQGAGNSSVTLIYEFLHYGLVAETNYYRLKQTDFDGSISYSSIEVLVKTEESGISFFPNPFSELLTIRAATEIKAIELVNATGEIVARVQNINDQNTVLPLSELASGVYTMCLIFEGKITHHQVIKK